MSKNKADEVGNKVRKNKDIMTEYRWKYLKQSIIRLKGTNSYKVVSKRGRRKVVL